MIPRVIHQTWKTENVPPPWAASPPSWRKHHPGWEYRFWTDERLRSLIEERFPWFLDVYDGYTRPIQRVDAARYFILYTFGGVYSDLDIVCNRSLEALRSHDVVIPKTAPVGYSNDLLMTTERHPFFGQVINGLRESVHYDTWWLLPGYLKVMLCTGSMYLTRQYRAYPGKGEIHILPPDLYSSGNTDVAYVKHLEGNSWHEWDGRLITKLYGALTRMRRHP